MPKQNESRWVRFKRFFLVGRDMKLRSQRFISLRSKIESLLNSETVSEKEALRGLLKRMDEPSDREWDIANEVELALIDLYPDGPRLDRELARNLAAARGELDEGQRAYYQPIAVGTLAAADKPAVLRQVIEDLNWARRKRTLKSGYIKDIMKVVNVFGVLNFLIFSLLLLWVIHSGAVSEMKCFVIAVFGGGVGASFSLLVSLRRKLQAGPYEETLRVRNVWFLMSRLLVGFLGGAILFFFVRADYLGGDFFPELGARPGYQVDLQSLSGLVVWSIVAGFSETFVPGLLSKQEKAATKET